MYSGVPQNAGDDDRQCEFKVRGSEEEVVEGR